MSVERKSFLPWLVWICSALFYGYQFCLRVSPSVMTHELMASFCVESCTLGSLSALYYYSYAFLQIPAGSLLDKYGPRHVLLSAIILCGIGGLLFVISPSLAFASAGRFLMGAGSAFAFLGCVKIGTLWFSPQKLSFIIGCSILIGTTGAIGGGLPLSWAVHHLGWRGAMGTLALLTVAIFIFGLCFLKDHPQRKDVASDGAAKPSLWEGILIIGKNPQSWILGLYGILMYAPLAVFADLWGVPFLIDTYHLEPMKASGLVSLIYVGMGGCAPLGYLLLRGLKSYKRCLFLAAISTTVLLAILCVQQAASEITLACLLLSIGCALSGQFLVFPVVCEVNPLHLSATASGLQNMICMCSGVIFQPAVGWFLDWTAGQGAKNYALALAIVPVCTLCACFFSFFVKETYELEREQEAELEAA